MLKLSVRVLEQWLCSAEDLSTTMDATYHFIFKHKYIQFTDQVDAIQHLSSDIEV